MKQNNTQQITINIARDFSLYPGARYRTDGDYSGQQFYEDLLKSKLSEIWKDPNKSLLIDFDGTFGYASSFISEVFISVVRDFHDKDALKNKLKLKSDDEPLLTQAITKIIDEA